MKVEKNEQERIASGGLIAAVDTILLVVCGIVIAVRCQISETFALEPLGLGPTGAGEIGYAGAMTMVVFAGVIIAAGFVWFLARLFQGSIGWRRTALVGPLLLLGAAGVISTAFSSNKHTASIGSVNLLSQLILALLLVQLLNQRWKQRLMLGVLAAAGVTMAYRCWEQYYYELPELVREYEQNPEDILRSRGFEPGSYEAEQFANRLLSQDVGGYFLISNTTAAFFILSIMAALAVLLQEWNVNMTAKRQWLLIGVGLLCLAQVGGLLITGSKGGIGSWAAALLLLAGLWKGRKFLGRHWRTTIIIAAAMVVIAIGAIAFHGMYHGRLPTLSLWVRWQYWQAGGAIIAEHGLYGVGAENFGTYYKHYMTAAAPEVVKDPHSLPIALWSQWGLLGLVGFVWGIIAVAVRLARPRKADPSAANEPTDSAEQPRVWWPAGLVIITGVVLIRWLVSDLSSLNPTQALSIFIVVYLIPSLIWLTAFGLIQAMNQSVSESDSEGRSDTYSTIGPLVLGCGLLGFLLHNSIDFAIFRPGAGTCFFATAAVALAMRQQNDGQVIVQVARKFITRGAILLISFAAVMGVTVLAVRVGRADYFLAQSQRESFLAEERAAKAAVSNRWDPGPCYETGWRFQWRWYDSQMRDTEAFEQALDWLGQAAQRDPANYVPYLHISELYQAAAGAAEGELKQAYAENARQYGEKAMERYPIKSEILIHVGELLTEYGALLNRDNWRQEALELFEKALAGEREFRDQQQQMYPHRDDITSRLSDDLIQKTRERISKLREQDKTN